ncbi:uncharacterized protein K452DRAFT_305520 [Aplosporella prunicola CBS 121167]|uniref:Gem-associated protein 5 TPR domain-containing protein n=1 Tax=Aplosporella prunicola CBS 121167 TaxID=1176127 RepID=A0A6A6BQJ3_9PEZI|nr:uncharacterized protein K452DRAFT_305520 [Aplosporella prunicola CBS 121167]KAF2145514.1 hypothetical protein K452DRAFT_305520 [Aplosporella prunicola CBS 121167]
MSTGPLRRHRSTSRSSSTRADNSSLPPPAPSTTPRAAEFEPCAATASFFLYAQRNTILCLHHDTLAIERRFGRHREDVSWISADNVSERGAGRLVVSYDVGNTAIVWDLLTGDEVSRFASYEQIRTAAWMRNGNIAFGNSQGNIILFEPATSEHISARTIFDPITALAPAADCRTFAIGYLNGSILIASLQPSFTILHTLTTQKTPSPIINLAWHGSSSKQKSDMLATQMSDGDLRVWSVAKAPHNDPPCVIRILNRSENREVGPCWFAWSKNGRIVQYSEGSTYAWDVRTKKVTYEVVPTIDGVTAIANYGPQATLFTLGRNHTVQQYDLNPNNAPMLVANVQHVPANAPPSPPNSIEEKKEQTSDTETASALPVYLDSGASSEDEGVAMSPLQKIAQEMDQLEEERRDRVGPLSPVSSRSSTTSRSSGGSRKHRYRYDKPSSRDSESTGGSTIFSSGSSTNSGPSYHGRESMSIRSGSSYASSSKHRSRPSGLRQEVLRSPAEDANQELDLFPFAKARLSDVPFRMPQPGAAKTPDDLRLQMLSVVFGWEGDIEGLVRDELSRHQPGSATGVLLSKWLGDNGADLMASMIGSESMTSSDWMLLALASIGKDSQKKVGEAFVQRLLEKGDVHPAVAILLGLGEPNEAIEAYVTRKKYLEAIFLTCLHFPEDWQRISHLVRKWGEVAVTTGSPELAVRCFYCTSFESTEPWSSPRAQDAVFSAQKEQQQISLQISPPLSPPPGSVGSSRVKNAALKLVTNFDDKGSNFLSAHDDRTAVGITPIAQSALSPSGGNNPWLRPSARTREPSSARTATPGGYMRKRFPSKPDFDRGTPIELNVPEFGGETPQPTTAVKETDDQIDLPFVQEPEPSLTAQASQEEPEEDAPMLLSAVSYDPKTSKARLAEDPLPSPAHGVFEQLRQRETSRRNESRDRKPDGLSVDILDTVETGPNSGLPSSRMGELSPPSTSNSLKSAKVRSIDQYISSLEEANYHARKQKRVPSRSRAVSRERRGRPTEETREPSQTRGRSGVRYIKPAKRSPSSPVPMSPEDAGIFNDSNNSNNESFDDERYYKVTSPVEPRPRSRSRGNSRVRSASKVSERRARSKMGRTPSRMASRHASPERRDSLDDGNIAPPKISPVPLPELPKDDADDEEPMPVASPRVRQRSTSRRPSTRERSLSRRRETSDSHVRPQTPEMPHDRQSSRVRVPKIQTDFTEVTSRPLTKKELAQRELEERRMSLARRPSAPVIPHPQDLSRPQLSGRSLTDMSNSPHSYLPPYSDRISRSHTVDPDAMMRYNPRATFGTSTTSTPIGLPATPRALRHPRYMSSDPHERDAVPAVPEIPEHHIIQVPDINESQDDVAPLLPSTVYGQNGPQGPQRSASAPPEQMQMQYGVHRRGSASSRGSGNKRVSPPPITASIDETIHEDQVIIIPEPENPPLLAELQHLAGPPPPPPPPSMFQPSHGRNGSGVINIAIDEHPVGPSTTPALEGPTILPTPSNSPDMHRHRRGRGSVSESIGSRLRGVTERMRSTSRSGGRAKSPPMDFTPSPYESVQMPFSWSRQNTRSPPIAEYRGASPYESVPPPPPPPPPAPMAGGSTLMEQVIPPERDGRGNGYVRNPKEIRANMPPEQLQYGVAQSAGGMI